MNQSMDGTEKIADISFDVLEKKISSQKEISHYKTNCPGYKNVIKFINLLTDLVFSTGNKNLNSKYKLKNKLFQDIQDLILSLINICDETDLNASKSTGFTRFGHIAYRDWFDKMKSSSSVLINNIACGYPEVKTELYFYLTESFGNRLRIDYGTGHELNIVIFLMGLSLLIPNSLDKQEQNIEMVNEIHLETYVQNYGWDILALFSHYYLRLCRSLQKKFRLEPAGSKGVYNMDDFQYVPFLLGSSQLIGQRYISANNFYARDIVDNFKDDFIFIEAIDYILQTKRGPFNEHSYTLWEYSNLGSWDQIFRKIRSRFVDDVMHPFPIIQHFHFGPHILVWEKK